MFPMRLATAFFVLLVFNSPSSFAQSGSFSRTDIATGVTPWQQVVAGDFNRDGFPDLVFSSRVVSGSGADFSIQLLAGRGDGTFSPPVSLYSDLVVHLVAADINGDGSLDLLFRGGE